MSSPSPRPTIPAGDIARKLKLPGWLRWVLDLFRGAKITAGPVDIQLDEKPGAYPAGHSPLDSTPHQPGPPPVGGRRR